MAKYKNTGGAAVHLAGVGLFEPGEAKEVPKELAEGLSPNGPLQIVKTTPKKTKKKEEDS